MGTPPQPVWTGPVILTLCLSVLALILAGGSLVWQVVSWRRRGPRVRVVRIQGIGGPPQGIWFTGVKAENSGRLGTEVNGFGFELPDGKTIQAVEDFIGQPIRHPMSLPPGGSVNVMYNATGIKHALAQAGSNGARARPYADTGHGRIYGEAVALGAEINLMLQVD